jgi:Fe-coproporphyrin III synthase
MSLSTLEQVTRFGFLSDRVVHLHPTRRCNLHCLHCYSDSGPHQKENLDFVRLERLLPLLKAEGYEMISISGGEPLLYPHLVPLLDFAHDLGFRVGMITNGTLSSKSFDGVFSKLDALAISFDGMEASHNRMRDKADAFARASQTMQDLARSGLSVAAAVSLTRESIHELADLTYYLASLGATAIQVRPTVPVGRGVNLKAASGFSDANCARMFLVVLALRQELREQVAIHCDVAPTSYLWEQRHDYDFLLKGTAQDFSRQLLSNLVNPLVISEQGMLKPIAFDFNSSFDIGVIETVLKEDFSNYKTKGVFQFQKLIHEAINLLKRNDSFVDWFDHCTRLSQKLFLNFQ